MFRLSSSIKKRLVLFLTIVFCLPTLYAFYSSFAVVNSIDTLEKKTAWVKGCHYSGGKRKYLGKSKPKRLEIYLGTEDVKNMKEQDKTGEADIKIRRGKFPSLRELPKVKFRDQIYFYVLNDPYLDKTSLNSEPKIIGVGTAENPRSQFQLFLDVLNHYMNALYYTGFFLLVVLWQFSEKIFKTDEETDNGGCLLAIIVAVHFILLGFMI